MECEPKVHGGHQPLAQSNHPTEQSDLSELFSCQRILASRDFDGLITAALFRKAGFAGSIEFVDPSRLNDPKFPVRSDDLLVNLPPNARCKHSIYQNVEQSKHEPINFGSTAQRAFVDLSVEFDLNDVDQDMLIAADKIRSKSISQNDILEPTKWILLAFVIDPGTGLERIREFEKPLAGLMQDLVESIAAMRIDDILETPAIQSRVRLHDQLLSLATDQIIRNTLVVGKVAVVNLRKEKIIFPTNRYLVDGLYPECAVSLFLFSARNKKRSMIFANKSSINNAVTTNVCKLISDFGGQGTPDQASCEVSSQYCDLIKQELVDRINQSTNTTRHAPVLETHLDYGPSKANRTRTLPSATKTQMQ